MLLEHITEHIAIDDDHVYMVWEKYQYTINNLCSDVCSVMKQTNLANIYMIFDQNLWIHKMRQITCFLMPVTSHGGA